MPFYHLSYIVADPESNTIVGDYITEVDFEIDNANYSDFKEHIAAELECSLDHLVVLNFALVKSEQEKGYEK